MLITKNEFDRLQGAKRLTGLHPNVKYRMKDLQNMDRKSLKGDTHDIYKPVSIYFIIYRTRNHIRNEKEL